MCRNRIQAEKDALPNGASIDFTDVVNTPRQVYIAEPAGEKYAYAGTMVKSTTRQHLFVKIVKAANRELHLRTMFLTD